MYKEIDEQTFNRYLKTASNPSFLQTVAEKKFQEAMGNKTYLLGFYDQEEMIGAALVLELKAKFHLKHLYIPYGFMADYHNQQHLKVITAALRIFGHKQQALDVIIDPPFIYSITKVDALTPSLVDDTIINNLKANGYHHFGFNNNFESIQVRNIHRFALQATYDETLATFTKTTRKHLESLADLGVSVRKATYDDLASVVNLFSISASNKHFFHNSLKYYQNLYKYMADYACFYIAYLDFDYYLEHLHNKIKEVELSLAQTKEEMSKVNVGAKLIKREKEETMKLEAYEKELTRAQVLNKEHGRTFDIGALLSIKNNDEYITLTSGMIQDCRDLKPKYVLYNAHIKDAIQGQFKYVNFYGIAGDLDPNNPLYSIYELKKGFNGEVVSYIGEFILPINALYRVYKRICK